MPIALLLLTDLLLQVAVSVGTERGGGVLRQGGYAQEELLGTLVCCAKIFAHTLSVRVVLPILRCSPPHLQVCGQACPLHLTLLPLVVGRARHQVLHEAATACLGAASRAPRHHHHRTLLTTTAKRLLLLPTTTKWLLLLLEGLLLEMLLRCHAGVVLLLHRRGSTAPWSGGYPLVWGRRPGLHRALLLLLLRWPAALGGALWTRRFPPSPSYQGVMPVVALQPRDLKRHVAYGGGNAATTTATAAGRPILLLLQLLIRVPGVHVDVTRREIRTLLLLLLLYCPPFGTEPQIRHGVPAGVPQRFPPPSSSPAAARPPGRTSPHPRPPLLLLLSPPGGLVSVASLLPRLDLSIQLPMVGLLPAHLLIAAVPTARYRCSIQRLLLLLRLIWVQR